MKQPDVYKRQNTDRHFRRAKGWFGYQLTVKEEASRILITIRKDDRNKVAILLNNEKLAVNPMISEADKGGFITLSYVLPQKLNTGLSLIHILSPPICAVSSSWPGGR